MDGMKGMNIELPSTKKRCDPVIPPENLRLHRLLKCGRSDIETKKSSGDFSRLRNTSRS
jgi:hypothetical protein